MNPRKAKEEKVKNAGISLEPKLIEDAKHYARKIKLGTISTLVRLLLVRELEIQEIAQWMQHSPRNTQSKPIGFSPPAKKNPKAQSGNILQKIARFPLIPLIVTFLAVLGISPDCHHCYAMVAVSFEDDDHPLLCAEIYNEGKNL